MKSLRVLAAVLLAVSLSAFADARFRTGSVKVGNYPMKVELAIDDAQRAQGLMFRKSLPREEGMLFVFDEPAYQSFWMKNTLIPLSIAFMDKDGVILNILDMEPQTEDPHVSDGAALYALEANKGWFAAKKIKPGDKVTGLPKPR
jgi:uncharacterized membrane protein (UPF0127 family)